MNNSGWLVYVLAFLATLISCQGHRIDYEAYSSRGVDDGRILLIARAQGIRVFTVGTNATSILRAPHRSDGVSFDAKTGKIYWLTHSYNNQQEGGIYSANLGGGNSTMLVSTKALGKVPTVVLMGLVTYKILTIPSTQVVKESFVLHMTG